jgi:alpha-tubulin suppressor-like RCC1 family protein
MVIKLKLVLIAGLFCFNQITKAQVISGGSKFSLFLCNNGIPRSCGFNNYGQLGDGSTIDKTTAANVGTLTGIIDVDCGGSHSLFLQNNGNVWASGWNIGGSLGDGSTIDRSNPVQVNISNVKLVSAGRINSLFLKNDSTVWVCGNNWYGSLGLGTSSMVTNPVQVNSLTGMVSVSSGGMPTVGDFSLFLKRNGTVWSCGYNVYGSLGTGTTSTEEHTPVLINGLSNVKAISAGGLHSLFLKNDGTVWACGSNSSGQTGINGYSVVNTPMQIASLSNIIAIEAGYYHSLFLKNDGTVWACGSNFKGQLGDGTVSSNTVPVQVSSLSSITEIAAGETHSMFLKSDGTVWVCGSNGNGELGVGLINANPQPTAVQVTSLCVISSVKETAKDNLFSVYPNPATTILNIKITDGITIDGYVIMDVLGRIVLEQKQNTTHINIEGLNKGMYQLVITSEGRSYTSKFIKESN